jgi:amidase
MGETTVSELAFNSATELAAKIQNKEISAVELLNYYLGRVDQHNGDLNAVVVDTREQALKDAQQADDDLAKGRVRGPLHGVPMTVKESFHIAGTASTWGNPALKDNVFNEDAEAVKKLKAAGANVFGKTNIPISLADFQSYNDVYGTTNNPYDHSRGPGGSSGGSAAALAAGLTGLEIGSDIGGSIRNPAHFCGVFGHKPTHGLLWMKGHAAAPKMRSTPDISVIGPLARSASDLRTSIDVIAGPDPIVARGYKLDLPDLSGRSLKDLHIGIWRADERAPVAKEVEDRVNKVAAALRDAGARLNEEARPAFDPSESHDIYGHLLQATMASRMPDADYNSLVEHVSTLDPADQSDAAKVFRGQVTSFRDWAVANEARNKLRWAWHDYFSEFDALVMPIMATPAFKHDHRPFGERTILVDNAERPYFEQVFWAGLTGVAFLPSTVIPTGLNKDGLPIGVQIVGPEFGDLVTIGVAQELERLGFDFTPPAAYR